MILKFLFHTPLNYLSSIEALGKIRRMLIVMILSAFIYLFDWINVMVLVNSQRNIILVNSNYIDIDNSSSSTNIPLSLNENIFSAFNTDYLYNNSNSDLWRTSFSVILFLSPFLFVIGFLPSASTLSYWFLEQLERFLFGGTCHPTFAQLSAFFIGNGLLVFGAIIILSSSTSYCSASGSGTIISFDATTHLLSLNSDQIDGKDNEGIRVYWPCSALLCFFTHLP